jgi:uncharacterized protein (DUF1330 family)
MPVYLINSYDIVDIESFSEYPPKVLPILLRYGAKVLASDTNARALEGSPKTMNAIIEFPSEEAVWDCYNDPEYEEVKKIRLATATNCTMVIVDRFELPTGR